MADRLAKKLAILYIESETGRAHHELDEVVKSLFKTLQERCTEREVFSEVAFATDATLFKHLACRPDIAAARLDEWMKRKLCTESGNWICIIPLFRVVGKTTDLGFEDLTFANPEDAAFWHSLDVSHFNRWNPRTGLFDDGRGIGFRKEFHSWLVGRCDGSKHIAKAHFRRKAQEATAALYAFWSRSCRRHKVGAIADDSCLAIKLHPTETKWEFSGIGTIYPCYGDEADLQELTMDLTTWNAQRKRLPTASLLRLDTALCFVNLAMCATDMPVYLHYFIALDALFGVSGRVGPSLIEGVGKVSQVEDAVEKTKWLFDLRNELVHGGSRDLHAWSRYPDYLKHFETEPIRDVETIVLDCLRRYPIAGGIGP